MQGYASKVACLTDLLRQSHPWAWTPKCEAAFQRVKDALLSAPVLALPDFQQPFEVMCDASGVGIGAVLFQANRPIAFESRKLNDAETRYTTGEQELLAVVHALQIFRCSLEGPHVVKVITDHQPLTYLPTKTRLSGRQARWQGFLSRFRIEWVHRPGTINVADPLSRHPAYAVPAKAGGHVGSPGSCVIPATSSLTLINSDLPPPPERGLASSKYRSLRDLREGEVSGAILSNAGASTAPPHGDRQVSGFLATASVPSPGVDDFLRGVTAGYESDPWLQDAQVMQQVFPNMVSSGETQDLTLCHCTFLK